MGIDPDFQVIAGSKNDFEEQVKAALQEGWEKWGEMAFAIVEGDDRYAVPMIRTPKPKPNPGLPPRHSASVRWG
ncbi:MAG TPA: hypothetical protein VFY65_15975 [Longimicrobium sp.]|nr:hypothetical protein [Longimicrobium sp.]